MGFSRPNATGAEADAFRLWGEDEHNDLGVENDVPEGMYKPLALN